MPRRRRVAIVLAVTLGHVLVIVLLSIGSRIAPLPPRDVTTLVFISAPPPSPPPARLPAAPPPAPTPPPRVPGQEGPRLLQAPPRPAPTVVTPPAVTPVAPPVATPVATPETVPDLVAPGPVADPAPPREPRAGPAPMVAVQAAPRPGERLRLFDADGSLALPADVVARLEEATSDRRAFDFQLPGLMESGTFMQRQPAIVYEETRFDAYWKPEQDVLTALLEEAVKRSTKSIEIPIPGSPGSKLVCTISVLAAGGGCGIRNNNDGYIPQLDDPDTLSPEEDRQCQAWWEQIVAATSQDQWRQTRELYEFSCRKPLEQIRGPP